MKYENLPRWFKSKPAPMKLKPEQIDRENGILREVVLAQVGEAKGHGMHLEQEFIQAIADYGEKHYSEIGLKSRFSHPSMSNETMGSQLGKFMNFQVKENQVVADMHILKAANASPTHPGMGDWVFDMAENDADFIMNSIVFSIGGFYQYDDEGNRYEGLKKDDDGDDMYKWGNPVPKFDDRELFVTLGELMYSDLVEAGAATDNLFAAQFNQDKFAVQAVEFVQEHPALHKFLQENPLKLVDFANQVGIKLPKPSFQEKFSEFKTFLFGEQPKGEEQDDTHGDDLLRKEAHESALKALKIDLSEKHENEMEALKKAQEEKVAALNKRVGELEKEKEELGKRVPEGHTDLNKKEAEEEEPKPKVTSRATQKALAEKAKRDARIARRKK